MSDRGRTGAKRTVSLSVIVGTLLVPLSAFAAFVLTDPAEAGEEAVVSTTTTATSLPTTTSSTVTQVVDATDDLTEACGPAGMELVALEESGDLTEIQGAALDALREICEDEGMPLPGKPAADPVVETVVVAEPPASSSTTSTTSPTTTSSTIDDHDDDERDDDEYEDEDDDDDHDEDDEYEDDHDEDDEDDR